MKKLVIATILIALLSGLAQLFLPWWIFGPIAFLVAAFVFPGSWTSFFSGFLGIALLWGISAGIINSANEGILASKMGELFGGLSPILLILITATIGGLLGGMSALTGRLGRALLNK